MKIDSSKIKVFNYELKAECCVVTTTEANFSWVKRDAILHSGDGMDGKGEWRLLIQCSQQHRTELT